ncbi:DUF2970 domain-containing protein [Gilvimarinus agarilyticus]|nr:DUF2970 domain-containing protein [Gilvimarinus sp. 2_MG-2023]MBU2887167.1 DUF2970 domain-containing protein [Gilvimarinus agarilyticus]MDO6571826.1 DUF2970 domain-containing protein [Gilvimarinus sp. 2_MG-2023]
MQTRNDTNAHVEPHTEAPSTKENKPLGFAQVVLSTLAAALGVQSNKNRERDFSGGNLKVYIVSGVIFMGIFIGGLVVLVNYLLASH